MTVRVCECVCVAAPPQFCSFSGAGMYDRGGRAVSTRIPAPANAVIHKVGSASRSSSSSEVLWPHNRDKLALNCVSCFAYLIDKSFDVSLAFS